MRQDLPWLKTLYPGYFALVMATGIVSVAARDLGMKDVSRILWFLAALFYAGLGVMYLLRLYLYRSAFWRDLCDAPSMFGFFTFVAATDVLGTRTFLGGQPQAARLLWAVAALAWLALVYTTVPLLFFRNERRLPDSVNGSWLILIVAIQSLVILGQLVLPGVAGDDNSLFFILAALWLTGVVFYLVFITFIMAGLSFAPLDPARLGPPYWIDMGATAISTVAGIALLKGAPGSAFIAATRPFLAGLTVLLWSWGTWWIPVLVIMGVWRHGVRRYALAYDPPLWGMVFPLGMYTVACFELGNYLGLKWLVGLAGGAVWVAVGAWSLTCAGWLLATFQVLKNRSTGRFTGAGKGTRSH